MKSPLTFQSIILTLEKFWAERGCLIWQPHHTEVGAGTMNPGTVLRVLGPEPWNIAYVEPSIRPDDGRYGDNPNRLQQHYQYQVILKPDPGNPQELYLQSLEALGIDPREHDIRFVEDNWESPALGAWGLGWEVWLDGQEITQFTYFQQSGGFPLDPVAVELTYGLERIAIALQKINNFRDIQWAPGIKYGDVNLLNEREQSTYYFEVADVERLRALYDTYNAEAEACLARGLVLPAHDYVLKMSHTFNVLDARGAIGVTERQAAFGRMRGLARKVSEAYLKQRQEQEYPLLPEETADSGRQTADAQGQGDSAVGGQRSAVAATLLLEIGTEELPSADVDSAHKQLAELGAKLLDEARLAHGEVRVFSTPRRLALLVAEVAERQPDRELVVKGPPAGRAFDAQGLPTPAAEGFARKNGVEVSALERRTMDGGEYVVAVVSERGKSSFDVLAELLPKLVAGLKFEKTMRWRAGDPTAFSRPVRWVVALLGDVVVPFAYGGLKSGRESRGLRPLGSKPIALASADAYLAAMASAKIEVDPEKRRGAILRQARKLAKEAGGVIADLDVLDEVVNLVERPTALLGSFAQESLVLPREALVAVMKKHQRYFPVQTKDGKLLPHFIAVRNGDTRHLDLVRDGNEQVIRARFADAAFFLREDSKLKLEDFLPRLNKLTFQAKLGSMLDKAGRIELLAAVLADRLGLGDADRVTALRAAKLAKADLGSQMVVEMTSLQGIMGYEYAMASGETPEVALAIREQYGLPESKPGIVVALADRLDSLTGLFAAGLAPSGSADPFGLRRAALSVNQILIEHKLAFDLRAAVQAAADLLPATATAGAAVIAEVLAFLAGRLRGQLLEMGYRYDLVDAVLAERGNDPAAAVAALKDLDGWVKREEWPVLLAAYARSARILRGAEGAGSVVDAARLSDPAEVALAEATAAFKPAASFAAFAETLSPAVAAINTFFDKVMVMDQDPAVRANRLALLGRVAGLASGLADLSKIEGF